MAEMSKKEWLNIVFNLVKTAQWDEMGRTCNDPSCFHQTLVVDKKKNVVCPLCFKVYEKGGVKIDNP